MGAEHGAKDNGTEDGFIQGYREGNWTGEVLKSSQNTVKCRIFLKGG